MLVELENLRARALADAIDTVRLAGVENRTRGADSLLVELDPLATDVGDVTAAVPGDRVHFFAIAPSDWDRYAGSPVDWGVRQSRRA